MPSHINTLPLEPPSFPLRAQWASFHCVCHEGFPSRRLTSFCSSFLLGFLHSIFLCSVISKLRRMCLPTAPFPWIESVVWLALSSPDHFSLFFKLLLLSRFWFHLQELQSFHSYSSELLSSLIRFFRLLFLYSGKHLQAAFLHVLKADSHPHTLQSGF